MPIVYRNGDLLQTKARYICHQVNCQGVMGSGVARQIKEKFPAAFTHYKLWCDKDANVRKRLSLSQSRFLGRAQVVYGFLADGNASRTAICNLYAQDRYGSDGKRYTDYQAFARCLTELKDHIPTSESIAMPYNIGCGLGGGDWEIVLGIIERVLSGSYTVELWKKQV